MAICFLVLFGCQNGAQTSETPIQKHQQPVMFVAPSTAIARDFSNDVYTISADGHDLKQLTGTGDIGIAYFSPDANKILYNVIYDGAAFHWYLMNSDGQNQRRLTDEPIAANVKWAPAQDLIIYDNFNPSINERNLILHNTETGAQKEIPALLKLSDYTIAPDGRIWCLIERDGGDGYELIAQQADNTIQQASDKKKWGKTIAQLDLPDTVRFAGWSPDGKHLLLNSYENERYYLWLMEGPGFEKGQIKPPYRWHSGGSPVWNSDGSQMAFIDEEGIWTAEPGQTPSLFWSGKNIAELLQWVGDEVVFKMSNRISNNSIEITVAKTDGEHQTVLATISPPSP